MLGHLATLPLPRPSADWNGQRTPSTRSGQLRPSLPLSPAPEAASTWIAPWVIVLRMRHTNSCALTPEYRFIPLTPPVTKSSKPIAISETEVFTAASTQSEPSLPPTFTPRRARFVLRSDGGFLAASHSPEGAPIRTVPDPRDAYGFVDYVSAVRRAQALTQLGWRNLRIVETIIS